MPRFAGALDAAASRPALPPGTLARRLSRSPLSSRARLCRRRWLGVSVFVVFYSFAISVSLPFFSTLVSGGTAHRHATAHAQGGGG